MVPKGRRASWVRLVPATKVRRVNVVAEVLQEYKDIQAHLVAENLAREAQLVSPDKKARKETRAEQDRQAVETGDRKVKLAPVVPLALKVNAVQLGMVNGVQRDQRVIEVIAVMMVKRELKENLAIE